MTNLAAIDSDRLPSGIRSVFCDDVNGLRIHYLEAGWENGNAPVLLLLHGFPELAYSWRKVMLALAKAGYRVIAPDQRGYGRTTGWDRNYDCDLSRYNMPNLVKDATELLSKLGVQSVEAVVGHDFGSSVAAFCALSRPDIFKSVALMSAPFSGAPKYDGTPQETDIDLSLAELSYPRKHYQRYYSTAHANHDMMAAAQGLKQFLRDYFFSKSADWKGNAPYPLTGWTAAELAKMPTYYIMHQNQDMAETAAEYQVDQPSDYKCTWLNEEELAFYETEYSRTGFQGGLHWYRCRFEESQQKELQQFAGKKIEIPAIFISGKQDWGVYQIPRAIEKMANEACTPMVDIKLIDRAGHWGQQEQPEQVVKHLLEFLTQSTNSR
jgi:pimeloyl-ACP methyl ester carboxylesterase